MLGKNYIKIDCLQVIILRHQLVWSYAKMTYSFSGSSYSWPHCWLCDLHNRWCWWSTFTKDGFYRGRLDYSSMWKDRLSGKLVVGYWLTFLQCFGLQNLQNRKMINVILFNLKLKETTLVFWHVKAKDNWLILETMESGLILSSQAKHFAVARQSSYSC